MELISTDAVATGGITLDLTVEAIERVGPETFVYGARGQSEARAVSLKPGELPPAFEGRWGLRPADCDIARSDTRGLLVIRGSDLTFYAVSGKAKVIGGPSRYNVIADLTFSDKGKTAPRREQYELASAGTTLLRTDPDGKKFRYERC